MAPQEPLDSDPTATFTRETKPVENLSPTEPQSAARPGGGRRSLTDHAYDHVRQAILHGDLPVGTVLAEATIADELGISKTPMRQALQLLRTEGLLEVGPRRQLVVRGFSEGHRNEVLRIREALEEIAVETACRVITFEQIDQLQLTLLRQKRAADAHNEDDFLVLDEQFHILIARSANLPIVAQLLEQMRGFARLMRLGRSQPPEHLQDILVEHTRIVEALEARDVTAALTALHDHLHHWDYLLEPTGESETGSGTPL
jgi:DNA-binding GntR family transcriptional regulator